MNKKLFIVFISILMLIFTIYKLVDTYAIFESNVSGNVKVENAKWIINVNNTNISSGINEDFVIDHINVGQSNKSEQGKLAPGLSGDFNIVIDPKNTDVSIKYEISFDLSELEKTKIKISSIKEIETNNELILTNNNVYTGIINLDEIKKGIKNNIAITVIWNEDETTNVEDTQLGSIPDNKISIPVNIKVTQYLGEEIKPLTNEIRN